MKPVLTLIAALSLLCTPLWAQDLAPREGWAVHTTTLSPDDLHKRVRAAVKTEPIAVVTHASASDGAKGAGINIPNNRVLGLYRNDYARRMLAASVAAGIEAPIRMYITENQDGSATLSYKTPSAVFGPYMDEGGEELRKLASELDEVFRNVAEKATKPE